MHLQVFAFGECLIDMLNTNPGLSFQGAPGGAPCNVLAQMTLLGHSCALISAVGQDAFGAFLLNYLKERGICTDHIHVTKQAQTTLAFVMLDENHNRHFSFYRNPGADMFIEKQHIPIESIRQANVFVYGGVSMTEDPARSTLFDTLDQIKDSDVLKAFDPNLRFALWKDPKTARDVTVRGMAYADIVKLSDEELLFLTACSSEADAVSLLFSRYPIKLLLVTKGPCGCTYYTRHRSKHLNTYNTCVQDTTASGDSFFGSFLHRLLLFGKDVLQLSDTELDECVDYANAAGAMTATRKGAITALPDDHEIIHCQRCVPKLPDTSDTNL